MVNIFRVNTFGNLQKIWALYLSAMILFPLRPASLTHKNPQGRTKSSWHANINRSIDRSEDVFVQYHVHVISVAVLVAV